MTAPLLDPHRPERSPPEPPTLVMPRGRASREKVLRWMRCNFTKSCRNHQQVTLSEIAELALANLGERPRLEHLLEGAEAIGASVFTRGYSGETFVRMRRLP